MTDKTPTSGGVELTDELIERLAREAEEGYEVNEVHSRTRRLQPVQELETLAAYYDTHDTSPEMEQGEWIDPCLMKKHRSATSSEDANTVD